MSDPLDLRPDPDTCTSLFLQKGGLLLLGLRHYTRTTFKDVSLWTTPGGRCSGRESVKENLLRETREETSIVDVSLGKFLGKVPGAKAGDTLYVFIGSTHSEPALMEPDKFSEWRWFNPAQVPENFINPAALALYQQYLLRP